MGKFWLRTGMLALLLTPVPGPAGASPSPGAAHEAEFLTLTNELRAARGVGPLEVHPNLTKKARAWAGTMADAGEIWHSDLVDGITADWHRLGENVGVGGTVQALHDALVASPSHYANLVDPGFTFVGFGLVVDGNGRMFVTQEFMEARPAPTPAPVPITDAVAHAEIGTIPEVATPAGSPAPAGGANAGRGEAERERQAPGVLASSGSDLTPAPSPSRAIRSVAADTPGMLGTTAAGILVLVSLGALATSFGTRRKTTS